MSRPAHLTADILDLLSRVVVCPSGCYLWTGGNSGTDRAVRGSNYPRCNRPGTRTAMAAHRRVFELFNGPIPDGFTVDHVCAEWVADPWLSRLCVRPEHLEAISGAENTRRMIRRRRRTHPLEFIEPPQLVIPDAPVLLAPGESAEDFADAY
ncbi:HNH endonuclease signature motif containing protein [Pseudorhodoplanes sp.]|uniref:HNH endonuclease signature motif containing protein n=1 Tax=Pseudorhodoplanes sp. TaxID=1934341 RepID=UPI003D11AADA